MSPTDGASVGVSVVIATAVAAIAWGARSLTRSGAVAAALVGTAALRASWTIALLLVCWFIAATIASRIGSATRTARVASIVEKGGRRDALQVLSNGGVFAICATVAAATRGEPEGVAAVFVVAALGALAAAGADTWATEFGVLATARPWSVRLLRPVPAGTSGAVSPWGLAAMFAFTALFALAAWALDVPAVRSPQRAAIAVLAGGVIGAMVDTLIGAFVQERRHCPSCGIDTEQRTHACNTRTILVGGLPRMTNDLVNGVCTLAGACSAAGVWLAVS